MALVFARRGQMRGCWGDSVISAHALFDKIPTAFLRTFFKGSDRPDVAATFSDVIAAEREAIRLRRRNARYTDAETVEPRSNAVGLALSGGGIRSATFSLGVLQALDQLGVLRLVDYLSTVSGGGFVGGWWSAWLSREERAPGEHFPPAEDLEPARREEYATRLPVGALAAGTDPIHHLRLFSNYLTPRKGLLSSDTWRAAAVLSRNLLLTWLVLVPVMLVAMLIGQLYFIAQPFDDQAVAEFVHLSGTPAMSSVPDVEEHIGRHDVLWRRTRVAARPLLAILVVMTWMTINWMRHNSSGIRLTRILNFLAVLAIFGAVGWGWRGWLSAEGTGGLSIGDFFLAGITVIVGFALHCDVERMGPAPAPFQGRWWTRPASWLMAARDPRAEQVRANRASEWQTRLLMALVVATVTLGFAGFAHELIITAPGNLSRGQITDWKDAITAIAGALTAAGTIFTAVKVAPTGGRDAREVTRPSKLARVIFSVTPVLVVLVLAAFSAWLTHRLMISILRPQAGRMLPLVLAAAVGLALTVAFAFWENWEVIDDRRRVPWAYPFGAAIVLLLMVGAQIPALAVWRQSSLDGNEVFLRIVLGLALGLALLRFVPAASERSKRVSFLLGFVVTIVVIEAVVTWPKFGDVWRAGDLTIDVRTGALLAGIALLSALGGWIIALGWMADPNALSLHTFYKSRLVRAYLGASNTARYGFRRDITESEVGDDIRLAVAETSRQGGPYLLVNTTLNLVGGRDLATAQRSAAHFLLSPRYCDSERTQFRPTDRYMGGAITLGAAMAASGAAVSPNMGSATPSAALALLLAFLNIRLGLWVPTPDRAHWSVPQTRLWPALLLKESLSQTTDVSSSCYLSDGGHFDNTGLYPLVARGCRLIILSDNGADAGRCFEDVGTAIRRCRIDFAAEIALDVRTFRPLGNDPATAHVAVGTITYDPAHLAALDWSADEQQHNVGTIVWLKPVVLDDDPAADVQQYGFENTDFPQQSTANQWFGESQFESYRKLGELSGLAAFEHVADGIGDLDAAVADRLIGAL